jgi:nucleoside-diphosphate-sugar epimerase
LNGKMPTIFITGASGFIGRHLLDELKNEYRIFAIARRSQYECNAPIHPNIAWIRVNIVDRQGMAKAFREAMTAGGIDFLLHLAAYYEFSGENSPEYITTNVDGTRNILELAKDCDIKLFVFASSVAACSFPKKNEYVDELSAADGDHYYARSKCLGEEMVKEYSKKINSCIVRFGAVYSDWCEYPPLYIFLNTWLGKSWRARILAGKGMSAIPYIHIRDILSFFRQLLLNKHRLVPAETVLACTRGSTSHLDLFTSASRYFFGKPLKPIFMPKLMCGFGLYAMNLFGRMINKQPFERPWMRRYIDKKLNIDNTKTNSQIGWMPNTRYLIENRIPYLIERLKSEPYAWQMRNLAALRRATARTDFNIYTALSDVEDRIIDKLFKSMADDEGMTQFPHMRLVDKVDLNWFIKLVYRLILSSVHTGNKLLVQNYFDISSYNRFQLGYSAEEIVYLLRKLNTVIVDYLKIIEDLKPFHKDFYDYITLPFEFAIDEIEQQYRTFLHGGSIIKEMPIWELPPAEKTAREQLEETIWNCLVHRK